SERAALLKHAPAHYAAWVPEAEPLLAETVELAAEWDSITPAERDAINYAATPFERCLTLGRAWEVDFLLLKPTLAGLPRLVGGCVCFPSSWSLEEKFGRELPLIHEAVPGLNPQLGTPINNFLNKLRPGVAFQRHNWGLSRWPDLNQHPALGLSKLQPPLKLDEVWLRVEYQALVALARSGGVLFGIRIAVHPLSAVATKPDAARGLHRALQTMPEAMARYKNLWAARDNLLRLLTS
ncbi:MAG TPA: heme-dependent oxidative N-demethylase subunit alpha family protein, partial [Verrucomicrobiae bacterium]